MIFKRQKGVGRPGSASGKNNRNDNKFSLVSCRVDGIYCKSSILPELNRLYAESETYRINKEYPMAIERLELALRKTHELQDSTCALCVAFFQQSIRNSIETMNKEMTSMSSWWLRFRQKQAFGQGSLEMNQLKSA